MIFVSHDRYFVDKIAKKLFVYTGGGELLESFQPYTQYLEIAKEIKELNQLSSNIQKDNTNSSTKSNNIKKVATKLTYKDQREYDNLPTEIEQLEQKLEQLNKCVMDPACYEQKGLLAVSQELDELNKLYEAKVDRFLELEELVESFSL